MKRIILATLCAMLLLTLAIPAATAEAVNYEGPGFATPQEACQAYIDAYNAGDAQAILGTFAVETYVDHMDRKAMLERNRECLPIYTDVLPMPNEFLRGLLVQMRVGDLSKAIYNQFLYYSWPEDYGDLYSPVSFGTDGADISAEVDAFYGAFENAAPADWAGNIELVRIMSPEELGGVGEMYAMEGNQKAVEKLRVCHGSDEISNEAMLLRIGGEDYIQFMQCERYGDRWYNTTAQSSMMALIAGLEPYQGGLVPLSALE